jgi:thymidylate kinase
MRNLILEGITGSGKSTSIKYIQRAFQEMGYSTNVADCKSFVFEQSASLRNTLKDYGNPLLPQLLLHQLMNHMKILDKEGTSDIIIVDRFAL